MCNGFISMWYVLPISICNNFFFFHCNTCFIKQKAMTKIYAMHEMVPCTCAGFWGAFIYYYVKTRIYTVYTCVLWSDIIYFSCRWVLTADTNYTYVFLAIMPCFINCFACDRKCQLLFIVLPFHLTHCSWWEFDYYHKFIPSWWQYFE